MITNDFNKSLQDWLARANEIAYSPLSIKAGKKYIKVIAEQGSVFCFIDIATGNVLKAATWAAPAPHARGNIYQVGKEGIEKYGAHYLI